MTQSRIDKPVDISALRPLKKGAIAPGSAWAVVTGAGSGIGRAYALQLAALGYRVVLVGNSLAPLEAVAREVEQIVWTTTGKPAHVNNPSGTSSDGAKAVVIALDLARLGAAQELYDSVTQRGIEVDVLINNAGIFSFCDLLATPPERIERIILLHDVTVTELCRLYAAQMVRRAIPGRILNMSSFSLWMPFPGLSLYSASKAYMHSFSVAFAKEVRRDGIRVTAVCPAGVATDLYGLSPRWQRIGLRLGVLITPESCARRGLRALRRGRRSIVPDWWNRAWIPLCKILPLWVIDPIRRKTMKFQK